MKRIAAAVAVCCFASIACAQDFDPRIVGSIADGHIALTNTTEFTQGMLGLDVSAANGGLKAVGAAPFALILLDLPTNVVIGNLAAPFDLEAGATVKTDITFIGSIGDLSGNWGEGRPREFRFVPEPSGVFLACFALGLLAMRRRRT